MKMPAGRRALQRQKKQPGRSAEGPRHAQGYLALEGGPHAGYRKSEALLQMSGNPSYTATCVQSEFGALPSTLAFLLYTLTPLYYPYVSSGLVRRHPSSATSEFVT